MSAVVARRYFVRGREYLRAGAHEDAAREFSAALELDPDHVEARVGLALVWVRGDAPRAAQLLRSGLGRTRHPAARRPLLLALADVLTSGGDFPGAEQALAEAAQGDGPPPPRLNDRRGRLLAKTARFEEAFQAMLLAARER